MSIKCYAKKQLIVVLSGCPYTFNQLIHFAFNNTVTCAFQNDKTFYRVKSKIIDFAWGLVFQAYIVLKYNSKKMLSYI